MLQAYVSWWISQWMTYITPAQEVLGSSVAIATVYIVIGSLVLGLMAWDMGCQLGEAHAKHLRTLPRLGVFCLVVMGSWVFMTHVMLPYWPLLAWSIVMVDLAGEGTRRLFKCSRAC